MTQVCGGLIECLRFVFQNPFDPLTLGRALLDPVTILVHIFQALALSLFGNSPI